MTKLGHEAANLAHIAGVSHRFFSREGGTSPMPWRGLNVSFVVGDVAARVEENLSRTRFQLGVGRHGLFTVHQVHGNGVVVIGADTAPADVADTAADAVITARSDVAVGVRTADCAPILFSAKDGSVVGAAHAGWRGAVGGVLEKSIEAFAALGVSSSDVCAAVGPTIGPRRFEVGPEVIAQAARVVDIDGLVEDGEGDRAFFDLQEFLVRVLRGVGVTDVEKLAMCTFDDERFYSHRRDAGKTGRQLSAIARTHPPVIDAQTFG